MTVGRLLAIGAALVAGCGPADEPASPMRGATRIAYAEDPDPSSSVVDLHVVGGACIVDGGRVNETVVDDVSVDEGPTRVVVTVWTTTRNPAVLDSCADVGLILPVRARLAEPLGSRALIDGSCAALTPIEKGDPGPCR